MSLHIARLQAENYKRLVAVDIHPNGNVVTISGRNAQGKSSVLDAIYAALAGREGAQATTQPIRDGQDTAVVTLDLGDYIVTRRWTKDDAGTLTVETPPNASGRTQKYSSPQSLLNELLGKRAFDPLAFTRLDGKKQIEALISVVDLPFDPFVLDRERKGIYDQRTEVSREVTQIEGQLAAIPTPAPNTPSDEVSAADVLREFDEARTHNARIERLTSQVGSADGDVDAARAEVSRLEDALDAARVYVERAVAARDDLQAELSSLEPIDLTDLSERISGVDELNARIRSAAEHSKTSARLSDAKARHAALTAGLTQIDAKKAKALTEVEFPVQGLSFDDAGVTLNGIPLQQASAAEQLRVSAALAMAANPTLRILQVRDGSLLDTDSMRVLAELAEAHDYQVWVEVVDESGQVGIVIEDGQVAA